MQPIVSITNLSKTYEGGFQALNNINLDIQRGKNPGHKNPGQRAIDSNINKSWFEY